MKRSQREKRRQADCNQRPKDGVGRFSDSGYRRSGMLFQIPPEECKAKAELQDQKKKKTHRFSVQIKLSEGFTR